MPLDESDKSVHILLQTRDRDPVNFSEVRESQVL